MAYPIGLDASHWQGKIDWPKAAADGVQFAYIKCTQGMGTDPLFETNAKGAEAAGILWMPYAFLTASDDDATVQHFVSEAGPGWAVLDWETAGVSDDVVETWIAGLRAEVDRYPLAYYGLYPPDSLTSLIASCPRILPEYAPKPRIPAWDGVATPDWSKEWLIWQSSDRMQFRGETGNFDLDQLAIPFAHFKSWYQTGVFPPI
jgi:lysozyme